jgi:hypothetical protein
MKLLARAIVTGFGLALGAAVYKRVATRLGLGENEAKDASKDAIEVTAADGATDPGLR